eukprot:6212511-Pleurochrysis_carterae.AAC.3
MCRRKREIVSEEGKVPWVQGTEGSGQDRDERHLGVGADMAVQGAEAEKERKRGSRRVTKGDVTRVVQTGAACGSPPTPAPSSRRPHSTRAAPAEGRSCGAKSTGTGVGPRVRACSRALPAASSGLPHAIRNVGGALLPRLSPR